MNWLRKIIFAIVYTFVYFFLAVMSTGGGHGNFYLLLPALPWLFPLIAICFFGKLNNKFNRILFVMFMTAHYVILFALLFSYSFESDRGLKYGVAFAPLIWYLAGQLVIWVTALTEIKEGGEIN